MAKENYLPELLKNLQKSIDRIEKKTDRQSDDIGAIMLHTQSMSSDIEIAKSDIKKLQSMRGKKINFAPRALYLFAVASVLVLGIVASLLGINVSALFR